MLVRCRSDVHIRRFHLSEFGNIIGLELEFRLIIYFWHRVKWGHRLCRSLSSMTFERNLRSQFSPLTAPYTPLRFRPIVFSHARSPLALSFRSLDFRPAPLRFPLRSRSRSAHMLWTTRLYKMWKLAQIRGTLVNNSSHSHMFVTCSRNAACVSLYVGLDFLAYMSFICSQVGLYLCHVLCAKKGKIFLTIWWHIRIRDLLVLQ